METDGIKLGIIPTRDYYTDNNISTGYSRPVLTAIIKNGSITNHTIAMFNFYQVRQIYRVSCFSFLLFLVNNKSCHAFTFNMGQIISLID